MVKGTKVKISAPVMNFPDNKGKEIPVLMDLHVWNDMVNYITEKKSNTINILIYDYYIVYFKYMLTI